MGSSFSVGVLTSRHSTIPRVRLTVGDRTYHCETGLPRPDVGAAFPQFPQAAASGFSLMDWMPLGYQPAHLELSADGAQWCRVWSLTLCAEIAPLIARVDFPFADVVDDNPATVSGWALHPQEPIERLSLQVGGVSVECHYGTPRADVAANFPNLPQSDRCGFYCQINVPSKDASAYAESSPPIRLDRSLPTRQDTLVTKWTRQRLSSVSRRASRVRSFISHVRGSRKSPFLFRSSTRLKRPSPA